MPKLMHLYCTYQEDNPFVYTRELSCEGKMILEDDGWFEGLLDNQERGDLRKNLIFGYYYPNKEIDLYRIMTKSILRPPHHYKGNIVGNRFEGPIMMGNVDWGNGYLCFTEESYSNDKLLNEIAHQIDDYKYICLVGSLRYLYQNMYSEREKRQKELESQSEPNNEFNEEVSLLKKKKYK